MKQTERPILQVFAGTVIMIQTGKQILFVSLLCIIVAMVYYPGLNGPFIFDDFSNLVTNPMIRDARPTPRSIYESALSGDAGPTGRPLSMLSFALNSAFLGFTPFSFKAINLLIHVFNTLLVFVLAHQLTALSGIANKRNTLVPVMIAAVWSLHPIQVSTVLYAVQRMTELSAFFSLAALTLFIWARTRHAGKPKEAIYTGASLFVITPLAILGKENGALTPLYILLAEWLLLSSRHHRNAWTTRLLSVAAAIFIAVSAAYLLLRFDPVNAYANRSFTLAERLLTEARVIWHYIGWLLFPNTRSLGLFHDDIPLSTGLWSPPITLFAMLAIVALLAVAITKRKTSPMFSFGILLFFAGHLMESTFIPLEIAFEHRNYLPSTGLFIAIIIPLSRTLPALLNRRLSAILTSGILAVLVFVTFSRVMSWSSPFDLYISEANHHPDSSRALYEYGSYLADLLERKPEFSFLYPDVLINLEKSSTLDTKFSAGLIRVLPLVNRNNPDDYDAWLEKAKNSLREGIFEAQSIGMLEWISSCESPSCTIPDESIETLLHAALANKKLKGNMRSLVATISSKFYVNRMKDIRMGFQYLREAQKHSPSNPEYYINEAILCEALKNVICMKQAISRADELDTQGRHSTKIASLREKLSSMDIQYIPSEESHQNDHSPIINGLDPNS